MFYTIANVSNSCDDYQIQSQTHQGRERKKYNSTESAKILVFYQCNTFLKKNEKRAISSHEIAVYKTQQSSYYNFYCPRPAASSMKLQRMKLERTSVEELQSQKIKNMEPTCSSLPAAPEDVDCIRQFRTGEPRVFLFLGPLASLDVAISVALLVCCVLHDFPVSIFRFPLESDLARPVLQTTSKIVEYLDNCQNKTSQGCRFSQNIDSRSEMHNSQQNSTLRHPQPSLLPEENSNTNKSCRLFMEIKNS